jgi:hypothetical protein
MLYSLGWIEPFPDPSLEGREILDARLLCA